MQFEKITSLNEFMNRYGTEEQCRAAFFQERWPEGFHCPKCKSSRYCEIKTRNVYQCLDCHHQTTLYAGTIYAQSKLPLWKWFLARYLIGGNPEGFSTKNLSIILDVTYNTAWSIKRKLLQTIAIENQREENVR